MLGFPDTVLVHSTANEQAWRSLMKRTPLAALGLLCLLAVAVSAIAECAWVLWFEASDMKTHEI